MEKKKVLIIRFSSFGDIVQCSTVVEHIRQELGSVEIHWLTRKEFESVVGLNKNVDRVISFDRQLGLSGLLELTNKLIVEKYNYIYDAHNNTRSSIIHLIFFLRFSNSIFITRSKDRIKRILLFIFRLNLFPRPFKGIDSYLLPLSLFFNQAPSKEHSVQYTFDIKTIESLRKIVEPFPDFITLVPSAAWEMKRWPISHWKKLIEIMPNKNFVILGGKEDLFCEEIKMIAPERVLNLAGKLSLLESCAFISISNLVISADTGLLHVADVLNVNAISLMGPSAFGFTKSNKISCLEVNLACRPCSKDGSGNCKQSVYQKCMVDISPEMVKRSMNCPTTVGTYAIKNDHF